MRRALGVACLVTTASLSACGSPKAHLEEKVVSVVPVTGDQMSAAVRFTNTSSVSGKPAICSLLVMSSDGRVVGTAAGIQLAKDVPAGKFVMAAVSVKVAPEDQPMVSAAKSEVDC